MAVTVKVRGVFVYDLQNPEEFSSEPRKL